MAIVDRRGIVVGPTVPTTIAEGQPVKSPCRVATTANITLSGLQTIDGIALVEGDRVLVKDQTTGAQNGIYNVSTGGWTRARDFDGAFDVVTGTRVYVTAGTVNGAYEFVVSTTGTITIGTTPIAFVSVIATGILADAEAARNAAEAAQAASEAAASALGNQVHQYDTRALAIAATIPTGVQAIKITRYATGYPLAYATYVPGTSAGPMALQEAGGHYWELDLSGGEANVLWFGAKRDGVADDAPKICATMVAINARGGGSVYMPGGGTYLLGSQSINAFINCYSNITLYGDGDATILKVANGLNATIPFGWSVILPVQDLNPAVIVDNFHARNFKMDGNAANNGGNAYQNVGVRIGYGKNPVVENITFVNWPGSQCISFGVNFAEPPAITGGLIRGNRFENVGYFANSSAIDHSSIFFMADGLICTDNEGVNGTTPPIESIAGVCLVEAHGTNWVASHNTADNYTRLGNIAAEASNCINGQFVHNTGRGLRTGIKGFATAPYSMDQIIVADNQLRMFTQDDNYTIDFGSNVDNTAILGTVTIRNNSIWSIEADGSSAGIYAGISVVLFELIKIEGNDLRHLSGPGIEIGSLSANSCLSILDNDVINCGRTSDANYRKGIKVISASTPKAIKIGRNTIVNTSTAYMTHGININLTSVGSGSKVYEDDVIVNVATPYTISASGATIGPGL